MIRSRRLKWLLIVSGMLVVLSAGFVTAQVTGSTGTPTIANTAPPPATSTAAPAPRTAGQTRSTKPPATSADSSRQTELRTNWEEVHDRIDKDARARRWGRPVVLFDQDYTLNEPDSVGHVTVIMGSAKINGLVHGDVVAPLGSVQIGPTGVITGSLVVIGGDVTVAPGALIAHDLVVIGGAADVPPGFQPGGDQFAFGATKFGDRMRAIVPWITRGLLLGRPIVPNVGWIWWIVALFFILYFLVNLVFHEPVRASATSLTTRPLSSFMAGLLVLLLSGPLAILLTVSLIGILVVPFALCALFVAGVIGKVAITKAIGAAVIPQGDPASRPQSMRSFVIGSGVIVLLYMIPVVGLLTWALLGVFGLGSAVLAFFGALRRENPAPAKEPKPRKPASPTEAYAMPPTPPPAPAPAPIRMEPATDSGPMFSSASSGAPAGAAAGFATASTATAAAALPSQDLSTYPRAEFLERLAAFALDLAIVFIVVMWFNRYMVADRFLFWVLAYYIGFWTWKGTTIGGIICNLRVTRIDGAPLRFVDAVVRGLSGVFSIVVLGLGGLWILRDPERQAWHDKISGTYVVRVPRSYPI